jgi:hypothetical protein
MLRFFAPSPAPPNITDSLLADAELPSHIHRRPSLFDRHRFIVQFDLEYFDGLLFREKRMALLSGGDLVRQSKFVLIQCWFWMQRMRFLILKWTDRLGHLG